MRDQFFVYMVECSDGSYYVGITNDADRRVAEHNIGTNEHSYTFTRRPVTLVWSQEYRDPVQAIACEKRIKGWSRKKKQALIRGDWDEIVRLARASTGSARHGASIPQHDYGSVGSGSDGRVSRSGYGS